jgi:hypothetical protein
MPEDSHDKRLTIEYFERKGIEACLFPKTCGMPKNPDFELYIDGNLFAYCELKSIIPYELLSSDLPSGQICQVGFNNDPSFNNIQKKIHDASIQLKSANPNHDLPNILFFINHNRHRNVGDLKEVIGVPLSNATEIPCPVYPKYRKGLLIKNDLSAVDYIIFVEFHDKKERVEAIVLDDYAKDFIKNAGKDEKWAKEAIWKHSLSDTAYYFLLSESHLPRILKERISSKAYEILPKFV